MGRLICTRTGGCRSRHVRCRSRFPAASCAVSHSCACSGSPVLCPLHLEVLSGGTTTICLRNNLSPLPRGPVLESDSPETPARPGHHESAATGTTDAVHATSLPRQQQQQPQPLHATSQAHLLASKKGASHLALYQGYRRGANCRSLTQAAHISAHKRY